MTRKQKKGPVVRASREQIREIERYASKGPRLWPFGESRGPFNLLAQRPTHYNKYGRLYEAGERDYGELRDPDVLVSFVNIAKDAMRLPFYNSKSATLALVVKGKGYYEMVCPHLSRQHQRQGQEEGSRGQGEEGQEEGPGQEEGEVEGRHEQGQEKGEEEGSRGQGQGGQEEEGQEEGSRGQGEEKGEEGRREQGQEKGEEEGRREQGQGGQEEEGQEEGSRGQGQEKGEQEGSRGQGQEGQEEERQEGGSRGQGQGGQEREEQGNRGQGQGEEREARIQYEKVRASLSPNTVHYVPPAHPFITVASGDESLQIIYFELFAHGNQRNYLAGRNNFLRSMGKEEAELSYNTSAKEMQDIVHAQDDIGFSQGPQRGQDGGGSHMALESIMDFMGF